MLPDRDSVAYGKRSFGDSCKFQVSSKSGKQLPRCVGSNLAYCLTLAIVRQYRREVCRPPMVLRRRGAEQLCLDKNIFKSYAF